MIGSATVEDWLWLVLTTDPVIRENPALSERRRGADGLPYQYVKVHKAPVPREVTAPFIVYFREGAADIAPLGRGAQAQASILRYQVKVVDEGYDNAAILPIGEQLDVLLDGSEFTDDRGRELTCSRISELLLDNTAEGDTVYQQVGGIYEFYVGQS